MNLFMLQYSNFIKPMINNKMIPPKNIIHTGPILQTYNFNTFNSFQNVNPSFNNYYVNPVPCANSVSCHDVHGKAGIGNCAQTGLNKQGIGKTPDCDGVGKGKSELD